MLAEEYEQDRKDKKRYSDMTAEMNQLKKEYETLAARRSFLVWEVYGRKESMAATADALGLNSRQHVQIHVDRARKEVRHAYGD